MPSFTPSADALLQREVLDSLEPLVRQYIQRHRDTRKLWLPSELLAADEQNRTQDQERNLHSASFPQDFGRRRGSASL